MSEDMIEYFIESWLSKSMEEEGWNLPKEIPKQDV